MLFCDADVLWSNEKADGEECDGVAFDVSIFSTGNRPACDQTV